MSTEQTPDELGYSREPLRFAIPPSEPQKSCRSCEAPIFWIVTPAGRRMPVNPDGTSHFISCPNAAAHRTPKARAANPVELSYEQRLMLVRIARGESPSLRSYTSKFTADDLIRMHLIERHEVTCRLAVTDDGKKALEAGRPR